MTDLDADELETADFETAYEVLERAREWADGEDDQMKLAFEDAHAWLQIYEAQCETHGKIEEVVR